MSNIVIINGDWNDGDYITSVSELNDEELEKFEKAIDIVEAVFDGEDLHSSIENAVDSNKNLTDSDKILLDWIQDYFPYGYEGNGIHDYDITIYKDVDLNKKKYL